MHISRFNLNCQSSAIEALSVGVQRLLSKGKVQKFFSGPGTRLAMKQAESDFEYAVELFIVSPTFDQLYPLHFLITGPTSRSQSNSKFNYAAACRHCETQKGD
jgi:hypothetical protein